MPADSQGLPCTNADRKLPQDHFAFPSENKSYFDVYRVPAANGAGEVPVLLLHELPGLNCKAFRLARLIAQRGFTVYLPHLLGKPGRDNPVRNSIRLLYNLKWQAWSSGADSTVIGQTDELLTHLHRETGSKLGVIGMCLTGAFPIALMTNPGMGAAVVAQPALPLLAWTDKRRASLGISEARLRKAMERKDVPILGFRYELDERVSPRAKFETLKVAFPDTFIDCEVSVEETGEARQAHSVLTEQYAAPESRLRVERTIELLDLALRQRAGLGDFSCP